MPRENSNYVKWLEDMRQAVRDVLLGLDERGLNWRPLPERTNSIFNLAQHCAWVERWQIGTMVGGQEFPYDWSHNEDLQGSGEDAADLLFWLDEAATASRQILERLPSARMDETRMVERGGIQQEVTLRWFVVHTIEHYSEHIGQMRLTRQLWEAQAR